MADSSVPRVWVQSNDNATIAIDRPVAERSMLIRNLIEDIGDEGITADTPIPIPNVSLLPPVAILPPLTAVPGQRGRSPQGH